MFNVVKCNDKNPVISFGSSSPDLTEIKSEPDVCSESAKNKSDDNIISSLCKYSLQHVFSFLPANDLWQCISVCRGFREIVLDMPSSYKEKARLINHLIQNMQNTGRIPESLSPLILSCRHAKPFIALNIGNFEYIFKFLKDNDLLLVVKKITKIPDKKFYQEKKLFYREEFEKEGLEKIFELENLTHLDLNCTQVTDNGLKHLIQCKKLRYLNLCCTNVTDKGMKHLIQCKKLRYLDLCTTKTTESCFQHLSQCESLTTLCLYGNQHQITDEGVKHLIQFKNPIVLKNMLGIKITEENMQILQKKGIKILRS